MKSLGQNDQGGIGTLKGHNNMLNDHKETEKEQI